MLRKQSTIDARARAPGLRAAKVALGFSSALLAACTAGCGVNVGGSQGAEIVGQTSSALTGGDVLGFESPSGWTVSSGTVASTTIHTQGAAALAVTAPVNYTTLVSGPLASSLPGLAALTDPGSSVAVDLEQPTSQPNPFYLGALQLYASAPAENVFNQYLGQVELTGKPVGTFQTYQFSVPSSVRSQLAGKAFSDLTFTLALNAPSGATGTYIFDNLRTVSPAKAPVGAGPAIDLAATFAPPPGAGVPGFAQFTSGTIQIPASFHVKVGDAGTGTALLELGFGSTTNVACTYKASADATAYDFASCTTSNGAADIVAANFARLTIQSADPSAALTKIKAQLAYNALGDQVGSKLMPAIPSFWGETPSDINAIATAFFNSGENFPWTGPTFGTLPIPDFALRTSDGSPVDYSNGAPPPPGDPPFNFQGHMNQGGAFDAFWLLQGNFSDSGNNNDFKTALNSTAAVHGVVFGNDIDVADVEVVANTDTGTLTPGGFVNPSASVDVTTHLFGQQVAQHSLSQPGSLDANSFPPVNDSADFTVADFNIWIVDLQLDLGGTLGVTTTGNLATTGLSIVVTPNVAATVTGSASLNIVIASATLTANLQLIDVGIPLSTSAQWNVSTDPGVCAGTLNFDVNAQVNLTTLGGDIQIAASVGPCPFCWSGTYTLVSWSGIPLFNKTIFDDKVASQVAPLSKTLCDLPLTVAITNPTEPASAFAGVPLSVVANATRPGTGGTAGPGLPTPVPCTDITWTSSDPGAVFSNTTGCTANVTFSSAAVGTQPTITATATDAFGETGSASEPVSISPANAGPLLTLLAPNDTTGGGADLSLSPTFDVEVQVTEVEASGAAAQTLTVSCTQTEGTSTIPWGTPQTINDAAGATDTFGLTFTAAPAFLGNETITCTVTDGSSLQSSDSGILQVIVTQ